MKMKYISTEGFQNFSSVCLQESDKILTDKSSEKLLC